MRWFHAPDYDYGRGLPGHPTEVHGFVLDKPSRILRELIELDAISDGTLTRPEAASESDFEGLHDVSVLRGLHDPRAVAMAIELDVVAQLPAEMVWQSVVSPQLHAAGGTRDALRAAAEGEWAINLSGGYHHARPALAHGFCLVNDVALAVASLRSAGLRRRIAIVDLDLHQGDGNATFFAGDEEVFTFSMHEQEIFPMPKARSDLDLGLRLHTGDAEYLERLDGALGELRDRFSPQVVVYVAGSDPYRGDPLGSLRLSPEAMAERDRRVALFTKELSCGLVAVTAGGYSAESPGLTAAGFAEIARSEP